MPFARPASFTPNNTRVCEPVTISPDILSLVEDDEFFEVSLTSTDSVILPTEPGRVIIRDSNGRVKCAHRYNYSIQCLTCEQLWRCTNLQICQNTVLYEVYPQEYCHMQGISPRIVCYIPRNTVLYEVYPQKYCIQGPVEVHMP